MEEEAVLFIGSASEKSAASASLV